MSNEPLARLTVRATTGDDDRDGEGDGDGDLIEELVRVSTTEVDGPGRTEVDVADRVGLADRVAVALLVGR